MNPLDGVFSAPPFCTRCQEVAAYCQCDGHTDAEEAAQQDTPDENPPISSTWRPVDLAAVLSGSYEPLRPTVGKRDDEVGLFYPGRGHVIASESEAGKTWLQLSAHADEIRAGHATVFIDFEDDEGGVVGRLLTIGLTAEEIRARFIYIRPEEPITLHARSTLVQALGDLRPTLVTLDGVTEAMTMHGLNPLDNKDIARFGRMLVRPLTEAGPAVVSLDHVVKDREGRGRYALGGVHKLNGLNGAMYTLENRKPFGVGVTGRSGIYISKDRPGQLRRHSLPSSDGRRWFGDLVVTSHDELFVEVSIEPPANDRSDKFRPTGLMRKVSDALARAGAPLSKRDIEDRVQGKAEHVRAAVACLLDEGFIEVQRKGNAQMHRIIKPFTEEER
ncbi:hypothetical protein [Nonomuraea sp. B19D2]|uniref:hypothetical protein n=1 Tax=Nonomuraea sp. B19D2 TaxID=3159561 RepID=UPI0032DAF726